MSRRPLKGAYASHAALLPVEILAAEHRPGDPSVIGSVVQLTLPFGAMLRIEGPALDASVLQMLVSALSR
jgi:hypothetical protein